MPNWFIWSFIGVGQKDIVSIGLQASHISLFTFTRLPDPMDSQVHQHSASIRAAGQCSALTDQAFECVNKLRPSSAGVIALILIKSIFPHSSFTTVWGDLYRFPRIVRNKTYICSI